MDLKSEQKTSSTLDMLPKGIGNYLKSLEIPMREETGTRFQDFQSHHLDS